MGQYMVEGDGTFLLSPALHSTGGLVFVGCPGLAPGAAKGVLLPRFADQF